MTRRTVPSMEFSRPTNPRTAWPSSTAASTSGNDRSGSSSASARSAWVSRASSVNVPRGPRKATVVICGGWIVTAMDEPALRRLLADVRSGALAPDDAVARLRRLPFADLGFARVDHHRALRQGMGEAVYGP